MLESLEFERKQGREKFYEHELVEKISEGLCQDCNLLKDVALVCTERDKERAKERRNKLVKRYKEFYGSEKASNAEEVLEATIDILSITDKDKRSNLLGAVVEKFLYDYFRSENEQIEKSDLNCFVKKNGEKLSGGDVDCGFLWPKEGRVFECKLANGLKEREVENLKQLESETDEYLVSAVFTFKRTEQAEVEGFAKGDIPVWGRNKINETDISHEKFP